MEGHQREGSKGSSRLAAKPLSARSEGRAPPRLAAAAQQQTVARPKLAAEGAPAAQESWQSGGRSQPTRQGAVVRHLPLEACGSGRCHLPLPGPGLSHYLEPPRARLVAARAHLLERLLASVSAMAAGPAHAAARLVTVVARLAAKETAAWEQQHARLFLALPVGCAAQSPPALRGRHRHAHDAAAPATPHGEPAKLAQLPLLGQRSLELVIVVCQPVLFAEATEAEPSGYDLHERGLRHFA